MFENYSNYDTINVNMIWIVDVINVEHTLITYHENGKLKANGISLLSYSITYL